MAHAICLGANTISHTSPRSCELFHCGVIAHHGNWIDISAILAEEETTSKVASPFQKPDRCGFSYRACSDEQSFDAFHIELSRRIVIEAVLAEEETSTEPLP
ncbi:hypothetical protein SAMN05421736_112145 [Evansella caseinilytica]|uniref:Uncharacterized protein n=1 Tax=Evansella caseinilytica TaxID=1503961 RepID=A0A1H3SYM5_9BACI|nr:hypothetical protein [Evansella caseinilytica]SDZ43223.1 hypothetical protein SAMN05421736_112145 [Evansella caseinilytica]